MKITVYSTHAFEMPYLSTPNKPSFDFRCLPHRLTPETAILAQGSQAVCCFVTDQLNREVLCSLSQAGVQLVALRCAGFNNVDLAAAKEFKVTIVRVPAYSPYAVAEFTVTLMLALSRKIIQAHSRVREQNFLLEGLLGFNLHGKVVGVIGTGKIGAIVCKILQGFGCQLLAFDPIPNPECQKLGVQYVALTKLYQQADIITLHCPLNAASTHLIDRKAIEQMKQGVMLINAGRGALIDTLALIDGLKSGKIGYAGLDVYELEDRLFFQDLSNRVLQDDVYARLETFPNVLLTGHQSFFTTEALQDIFQTTMDNLTAFANGKPINTVELQ